MGKFTKGKSGNPKGRKPGTPNRATRTLRDAMLAVYEGMGGEKALLRWAKASKGEFFKILLTRLMPPGAPICLELSGSLADQGKAVIGAMAEGRITPEQASTVMSAVASQARVIEIDELERRVKALEEKQSAKP